MLRITVAIALCAILSGSAAACNYGSPDYQNCLYREDLNAAGSQPTNSLNSRPNPQGGYDYSNGVTSRANPQGGYDYSNGTTCRRNPSGGLDCQ